MAAQFSFGFAGDDIEDEGGKAATATTTITTTAAESRCPPATPSAFPVSGKPLLPPTAHSLADILARLPSKIAYSVLDVDLQDGNTIQIPRRELWDVRVQLMAEDGGDEDGLEPGLGKHDVKTGIYEGGFKSWESSVDLVRVLASQNLSGALRESAYRVIELGCGTALPCLALFQWAATTTGSQAHHAKVPLSLTLADYNPTVLYLVTVPNFILVWALQLQSQSTLLQEALSSEGELELTPDVLEAFQSFLSTTRVSLSFVSGAWCPDLVTLLYSPDLFAEPAEDFKTLVLGAETIYSPFALNAFAETLFSILQQESQGGRGASAVVGAKRLYFGVGGSLDDFVEKMRNMSVTVTMLREETDGVRRGVVSCQI